MKRRTANRTLRFAGVGLIACSVLIYAATHFWQYWLVYYTTQGRYGFHIADGGFQFTASEQGIDTPRWLSAVIYRSLAPQVFGRVPLWFNAYTSTSGRALQIPAWPLAAVGAGLLGWGWLRRRPESACQECGYDLRAVPADVCPECGTPRPPLKPAAPPAESA